MITITITMEEKRTEKGIEFETGFSSVGTNETENELSVYNSFKEHTGHFLRVMNRIAEKQKMPWYKRIFQ